MIKYFRIIIFITTLVCLKAQTINRYGTTTANFLEIGVGSGPTAMGDAYVAVANDVSSIYWNPAGLANLTSPSATFMLQPWLVDINMLFTAGAIVIPGVGNIGFGITQMDYGEMDVTTLEYQEGTGEKFKATDLAASFTYSRKIVSWFAFGSRINSISRCAGCAASGARTRMLSACSIPVSQKRSAAGTYRTAPSPFVESGSAACTMATLFGGSLAAICFLCSTNNTGSIESCRMS